MFCNKPSPFLIIVFNTLIVAIVCVLIDFIFITIDPTTSNPYNTDLIPQIIFTLGFSLIFGHLYNRASRIWRPNSDEAFIFKHKNVPQTDLCKLSWAKILNGIVFSLFVSGVIVVAMELGKLMLTTFFFDFLQGIRGDVEAALPVVKTVVAGLALETAGKTEDDPDR